jgi:glycosyltransferase 2 family protein
MSPAHERALTSGAEVAGPQRPAWRRHPLWRAFAVVAGITAVGLSTFYIIARLRENLAQLAEWRLAPAPLPLVAALVLTFLCILLGGTSWRLVLGALGQRPPLRDCLRAQFLSNLGGYLPGYGWKFVGKGLLSRRFAQPGTVSAAVLVEFASLAVTRLVVALVMVPAAFGQRLGVQPSWWHMALTRTLAMALLVGFPWALRGIAALVNGRRRGRWRLPEVDARCLLAALALMAFTWIIYGLGFALLVRAIDPAITPGDAPMLIFGVTSSYLASLLMFFVPAGLAIREGVVLLTLEHTLTPPVALAAAVLSRLVLLAAELLGAAVGALMRDRRTRPSDAHNPSMTPKD